MVGFALNAKQVPGQLNQTTRFCCLRDRRPASVAPADGTIYPAAGRICPAAGVCGAANRDIVSDVGGPLTGGGGSLSSRGEYGGE